MGANQPGPASRFQPAISRNCVAGFGIRAKEFHASLPGSGAGRRAIHCL
jgi:hypothetical protein